MFEVYANFHESILQSQGQSSDHSGHIALKASQSHSKGGNIELVSGSSVYGAAGDINLKSGTGSSTKGGGHLNIVASSSQDSVPKEINLGFEEIRDGSIKSEIGFQLKKSFNGTRAVSTVPLQVTTVQYSSDARIKKDITTVDTGDLLDRMRKIGIREYGYTDEWRKVRGLEENDVRVRGVIAQQLREVFPEHIQVSHYKCNAKLRTSY